MPRQEQHESFPNLLQAILILAVVFAFELLVAAAYCDIVGVFEQGDPMATGLILVFANGIVFSALLAYQRLSFASLFHPGETSTRAVLLLLTLPIMLLFMGLAVLLEDLMSLVLLLLPMTQGQYDMFSRLMTGGWASLITLCLLAPLLEEMLFRGIFLRSFLRQYPTRQAMVFSAALFAVAHLNIYQALSAFIAGLLLAWIYVRVRSLWPCVIAHAAYNLACFLLSAATGNAGGAQTPADAQLASFPVQVAALIGVALGGYLLWKLLGSPRNAAASATT